jgi:outer membrane protein assembly factor BamB
MKYMQWRGWLTAVAATTLLAACSSTAEPDYAELQEFDAQITPETVWRTRIGNGTGEHFSTLSPAYADGLVFAADRRGRVSALNIDNGRRVWRTDVSPERPSLLSRTPPARVSGGLVVREGVLYFGTENGQMFALEADSGDIKWEVKVPGEVISAPVIDEGLVVAHLGNGTVVALNEENGEEVWRHDDEVPPLSLRGSSTPAIAAGGVIVGTNNGRAAVLILENGQMAWDERVVAPSGGSDLERMVDIDASPVVRGENIYMLAFNGELVALDLRSGEVNWRRDYAGYRTPQVTGTRIFLTTQESHVVGLERNNGNERWRNNDLYGRSLTQIALTPDYVVVGDRFGYLHWLDRDNGQLVGRVEVDSDGIQAAPLRVDDYIIVQTNDGRVFAYRY